MTVDNTPKVVDILADLDAEAPELVSLSTGEKLIVAGTYMRLMEALGATNYGRHFNGCEKTPEPVEFGADEYFGAHRPEVVGYGKHDKAIAALEVFFTCRGEDRDGASEVLNQLTQPERNHHVAP